MSYFSYFPITKWNNTAVVDITARGAVVAGKDTRLDPRKHNPLMLPERVRPDTVAEAYYENVNMTWLVYLSAEVVDPWLEWYMTPEQFGTFIESKYGSIEIAQAKTHHWQLAWGGRTEERTEADEYETLLDDVKKYYEPVYGRDADIFSYRLRRDDWTIATNRFIRAVHSSSNSSFTVGEVVSFVSGLTTTGSVVVDRVINTTSFEAKHVIGSPTNGSTGTGMESEKVVTLTSTTPLLNVIPAAEVTFWEPVSCYDYELAKNEDRREIHLVDARWAEQARQDLASIMLTVANTASNTA